MKLLGVLSTYYPDLIDLERNIISYLDGLDYLIIWENTPKEKSNIDQIIKIINSSKLEIRSTGKNEFLAKPFNTCVKWAEENGFTHVLTMDQDSYFEKDKFLKFLEFVEENTDEKIAIFAPIINSDENKKGKMVECESVITSGSIHTISIFKAVGYYREDLMIHMGDVDFCLKVRRLGAKIVCFPEIVLKHQLGYACTGKFGFKINPYTAASTYYIVRNNLILWKDYPDNFSRETRYYFIKYKIVYRTLKLIFEPDTVKKLKAVLLGIMHGIIGKTGEYNI